MTDIRIDRPGEVAPRELRANTMSNALQLVAVNGSLKSRNVTVRGHRTSVRLEPAIWDALKAISAWEHLNVNEIVSAVALCRDDDSSLTSAIRIFVMAYFRSTMQKGAIGRLDRAPTPFGAETKKRQEPKFLAFPFVAGEPGADLDFRSAFGPLHTAASLPAAVFLTLHDASVASQ